MLRIALHHFTWKKRLRKILRKNSSRFEVKIRPFVPRSEVEDLWQSFKTKVHHWKEVPNLANHLYNGLETSSFHTHEVAVYDQGELVAFSLFDRGHRSIASLEAAYDQRYKKYSLGLFTMLAELEYCMDQAMDYYYPGFYAKDSSMFEYKLRPGNVEFYCYRMSKWKPWNALNTKDWVLDEVFANLHRVDVMLNKMGFLSSVKSFKKINYPRYAYSLSNYDFLTVGEFKDGNSNRHFIQVAWDPYLNKYLLFANRINLLKREVNLVPFSGFDIIGLYGQLLDLEPAITKLLAKGFNSQNP